MKPIKFNNNNHLPKEALILYKPKQKNNDMKSKEEILYDCTGMMAENHRTVIQAMEIHAAKVRTETIAETRSEMMEFAEWLSENPVIADNREETKTSRCVYIDDGNLFEFDTLDELFQYYLTNIKANENSR